ncbi:hypothetical protein [Flavobacterium degerlachei]|jgi:hypothetical protein|uniref:Uncharacterized protein n=1 Tax=Flavobacterium degerlachei TaxID=229203 RepID=A0A1H2WYG8_9FLAO|nr:hypothetical protein [Flavobacterium degerlachei]SDW84999.1 hypothetical protein SAMN05444338_10580 [Flavobacterium degerlachei]
MNNFSKQNDFKKSVSIFTMFIFILLSNVSAFSQTSENNAITVNATDITTVVKGENKSTTNMDFVLWFMGSKQDPNSTISTEGINTKKKVMTSGLAPNRLLIKAFLKKAVNFESALA